MAGKGILGKIGAYFRSFGKVGQEDEKVFLALRIADRLSISDLRKLDSGAAHVHFSPKRKPKMTEAEIERLIGMANVENPLGAGIGAANSFPYSAPDAESDKAANEGAFGV